MVEICLTTKLVYTADKTVHVCSKYKRNWKKRLFLTSVNIVNWDLLIYSGKMWWKIQSLFSKLFWLTLSDHIPSGNTRTREHNLPWLLSNESPLEVLQLITALATRFIIISCNYSTRLFSIVYRKLRLSNIVLEGGWSIYLGRLLLLHTKYNSYFCSGLR